MFFGSTILLRVFQCMFKLIIFMSLVACEHELKIAPEYDLLTVDGDVSRPATGIWTTQTYRIARPGLEIVALFQPDVYQCTNTICNVMRFCLSVPPLFPFGLLAAPFSEEKKVGESGYLKVGMYGRFAGNNALKDLFARNLSRNYSTSTSMGVLLRFQADRLKFLPYAEFRLSFLENRAGDFEVISDGNRTIRRAYLGNGDHLIDGGLAPALILGYSLGEKWLAELLYSAATGYELEIEDLENEDFSSHAKFQTFGVRLGYKL